MARPRLASLDALDLEADNIRAALRHCLADPDGADSAWRWRPDWGSTGDTEPSARAPTGSMPSWPGAGGDDGIRCRALFARSRLAVAQGDHAAGPRGGRRGAPIARRLDARRLLVADPGEPGGPGSARRRRVRRLARPPRKPLRSRHVWATTCPSSQPRSPRPSSRSSMATSSGCATSDLPRLRAAAQRGELFMHQRAPHECRHGRADARRPRGGRGGVDRGAACHLVIDDRHGLVHAHGDAGQPVPRWQATRQRAARLLGAAEMLRLEIAAPSQPVHDARWSRTRRSRRRRCSARPRYDKALRRGSAPRSGGRGGAGAREEGRPQPGPDDRQAATRSANASGRLRRSSPKG